MERAGDLLKEFFSLCNIDVEEGGKIVSLFSSWGEILTGAAANGREIACHARPTGVERGALLVEVDHPGWTQTLRVYQAEILKNISRLYPSLGIRLLRIRCVPPSEPLLHGEKRELRAALKKRLAFLEPGEREEKSGSLCASLSSHKMWPSFGGVAAFLPLPDEPDLRPLLRRALGEGKRVFLPRIEGEGIVFHGVSSLEDEDMRLHSFGMREPSALLPVADLGSFSRGGLLFLVPGLGFDLRGGRLGRGKGYYDRFFGGFPAGRFSCVLGAAFSCQIVERVPCGVGDFPVSGVVTEEGVVFVGG